jgi:hypothetical protein
MTFNWQITDRFTLAGHIVVHSAVACRLSPVACWMSGSRSGGHDGWQLSTIGIQTTAIERSPSGPDVIEGDIRADW